jgi:16S rRNA (cytosine1402-N4)-methyltransferase
MPTFCPFTYSLPQVNTLTHQPILLNEVLQVLDIKPGMVVIDATLGLGGHSKAFANVVGKTGKVYAFDWDARNIAIAKQNLASFDNIEFIQAEFSSIVHECNMRNVGHVDAIFFDLGISSAHLDDAERGFSYRFDAPLDMRMNSKLQTTAADLLADTSQQELARIIYVYGQERFSRQIAAELVARREQHPVSTTGELMEVIEKTVYRSPKKAASRVFQALRIAVNGELEQLETALPLACSLVKPQGRIATITFHSLEDRMVKQFFRAKEQSVEQQCSWQRINKKVIIPTYAEQQDNPRARSAKLRALEAFPFSPTP